MFNLNVLLVCLNILGYYCVLTCHHSNSNDQDVCSSFEELDIEGHDEFYNVLVEGTSGQPRHPLKANAFRNTPNIKKLSIYYLVNNIEPGAFKGLSKLQQLYIYTNDFETIIPEAFEGLNITDILLDRNNMTMLSQNMFKYIPTVNSVSIYNNNIKVLKSGVFNGTSIRKMFLFTNGFEIIEDGAFSNMNNLRLLNLHGNYLKSFDSMLLLGNNRKLKTLGLNRNNFTELTSNMFTSIPNLESLYIQINKIVKIANDTFTRVPNLAFLDLANNNIEEVNPELFPRTGMRKLTVFFLHNNQLTFVDNVLFTRLPTLIFTTLGGNPFQCQCLNDIHMWMNDHNVTILCKKDYVEGGRPDCIPSPVSASVCIYDVELHKELYNKYKKLMDSYPKLPLTCETGAGFDKATLRD